MSTEGSESWQDIMHQRLREGTDPDCPCRYSCSEDSIDHYPASEDSTSDESGSDDLFSDSSTVDHPATKILTLEDLALDNSASGKYTAPHNLRIANAIYE